MVMAAQPDQYFHDSHYRQTTQTGAQLPTPPETLIGSARASVPPTPTEGALAGRKRSRGDIYSDDEHDGPVLEQPAPPVDRGEPTYGPGMTICYPNDPSGAYRADAGSQSGTWVDDVQARAVPVLRPVMPTRKSQRLDTSSRPSDAVLAAANITGRSPTAEPLIDEATRLLGVSWTRMGATESSAISQRAYTRWIKRHYPFLNDVEVWFENTAIPGYLGKALNTTNGLEEYYLWSYDLHQAILITRNGSDLILKLSQPLMSLSQATEKIVADIEPVVEAGAANAAIVRNDPFIVDDAPAASSIGAMEID